MSITGKIVGFFLLLIGLGWLSKKTQAGAGLAELGMGVQEAISRIVSPQIRPTFVFRYAFIPMSADMTREPANGTSDKSNPDREPTWHLPLWPPIFR